MYTQFRSQYTYYETELTDCQTHKVPNLLTLVALITYSVPLNLTRCLIVFDATHEYAPDLTYLTV